MYYYYFVQEFGFTQTSGLTDLLRICPEFALFKIYELRRFLKYFYEY